MMCTPPGRRAPDPGGTFEVTARIPWPSALDCGAVARNLKTAAATERSPSAARLIDMYVVKRSPERTAKISIAKPIDDTEFLAHFR